LLLEVDLRRYDADFAFDAPQRGSFAFAPNQALYSIARSDSPMVESGRRDVS
jgi:hypothetical protein